MQIVRKEFEKILDILGNLNSVEGETREAIVDNYVKISEANSKWVAEKRNIIELCRKHTGFTEEVTRQAAEIEVEHQGENKPFTDEEKALLRKSILFNMLADKDIKQMGIKPVDVDIQAIPADELRKIAKESNLTIAQESILLQYFRE